MTADSGAPGDDVKNPAAATKQIVQLNLACSCVLGAVLILTIATVVLAVIVLVQVRGLRDAMPPANNATASISMAKAAQELATNVFRKRQ